MVLPAEDVVLLRRLCPLLLCFVRSSLLAGTCRTATSTLLLGDGVTYELHRMQLTPGTPSHTKYAMAGWVT